MKYTKKWMVVPYQEHDNKKIENPSVDDKINNMLKRKNLSKDIKVKLYNHLMSNKLKSNMNTDAMNRNDLQKLFNETEIKDVTKTTENNNESKIQPDLRNSYREPLDQTIENDDDDDNYNSSNTTFEDSKFMDTGILHLSNTLNESNNDESRMQVDESLSENIETKLNNSYFHNY